MAGRTAGGRGKSGWCWLFPDSILKHSITRCQTLHLWDWTPALKLFKLAFLLCFSDHLYFHHCHTTFYLLIKVKAVCGKIGNGSISRAHQKYNDNMTDKKPDKYWMFSLSMTYIQLPIWHNPAWRNPANYWVHSVLCYQEISLQLVQDNYNYNYTSHPCRQTTWTFCDLSLEKDKKDRLHLLVNYLV